MSRIPTTTTTEPDRHSHDQLSVDALATNPLANANSANPYALVVFSEILTCAEIRVNRYHERPDAH